MQYIIKYRLIVGLIFCFGLFLLVSIGNTVKKRIDSDIEIRSIEGYKIFDSTQEEVVKLNDTSTGNKQDSALYNGKSWRTNEKLQIIY